MKEYDNLKLENQLCFPLYACAKEIVKRYTPFLNKIDLTYTQYIVMMLMWEMKETNVKTLGQKLFLDSGTLTPVLKKLEAKGYISRNRKKEDERNVIITLEQKGIELKKKAKNIPHEIGSCIKLSKEEAYMLYKILYKILDEFEDGGKRHDRK